MIQLAWRATGTYRVTPTSSSPIGEPPLLVRGRPWHARGVLTEGAAAGGRWRTDSKGRARSAPWWNVLARARSPRRCWTRGPARLAAVGTVLAVAVGVGGARAPATAQAESWESLAVDLAGPVREEGRARLIVSSGCDNEISVQFAVGQRAPDGSPRFDTYDARGPQASPDLDFTPVRGTLRVSSAASQVIEVPVVDDELVEGFEHVVVDFWHPALLGSFVGDVSACETPGPEVQHSEAAFTIIDNDVATGGGSAPSAPSRAASPVGRSGSGGSATASKTPARAGPATGPAAGEQVEVARDGLSEGSGVRLGGRGASSRAPGRGPGGGVAVGFAAGTVGAGLAWWVGWRRRRGWG